MIIVFGPKQYGRDNVQNRYGFCEQCGEHGLLSSYDTSEFFTVYYVPLIPMGRKRIMDSCPACKMHREMSLRKYRELRDKSLRDGVEGMKTAPQDGEKAVKALQAYLYFGAREDFVDMAPVLAEKHGGHPGVQMMVGAGYEYYGDAASAERYRRQALTLADTEEHREALAVNLVYQDRPDEARPLLEHVETGTDKEKAGLLYLVAASFREQGRHPEALQMLEAVEKIDPDIREDDEHRRFRALSETAGETGHPTASQVGKPREAPSEKGVPTIVPRLVPLTLILLALGGYLLVASHMGRNVTVWVVSGTSTPYTVKVNDQSVRLRPYAMSRINMSEGRWEVTIEDTLFPMGTVEVTQRTPFFTRPFGYPKTVLNPDGLAVLLRETTIYSAESDPGKEDQVEFFCGKRLYRFRGVDYVFEEFPEQISISSDSGEVERSRLAVLRPQGGDTVASSALSALDPDDMLPYIKRRARMEPRDPGNISLLHAFCSGSEPEAYLALLREGMAVRPLLIDWHRMYQEAMGAHHPDHDLVSEYRGLVEAEPNVAAFKYLLGRALPDHEEATKLYLASEDTADPSGYGYNALAYMHMCSGDFEEALPMAEKAVEVNPSHQPFLAMRNEARLATGRYEDLLLEVQQHLEDDPWDFSLVEAEIRYLALLGRTDEAGAVINRVLGELGEASDATRQHSVSNYLAATVSHARGDFDSYVNQLSRVSPDTGFRVALLNQDVDAALQALSDMDEEELGITSSLLVYGLALKKGRGDEGQAILERALEQMSASEEYRAVEAMLRSEQAPGADELRNLQIPSEHKSVPAMVLGLTHPAAREVCFDIARLHNYQPGFPKGVVQRLME